MKSNTVNGIKFTSTELTVLSCFTDSVSSKPSIISQVLDKPTSTIYSHLDKIKSKIGAISIGDIAIFVKQSSEYKELKKIYFDIYLDYQFRLTANKISHYGKKLQLTYSLSLLSDSKDKEHIEKLLKHMLHTCGFANASDNSSLIAVNILDEDEQIESSIHHNTIKIILAKGNASIDNYTFYYSDNKKELYKFFVSYLRTIIPELSKSKECANFSDNINNIYDNILSESMHNRLLPVATNNKRTLSKKNLILLVLLIATLLAGILFFISQANPDNQPQIEEMRPRKNGELLSLNLPPRNRNFTGRALAFAQLRDNLNKSNLGITAQSIVGAGGIGKTQFATEYAYRAAENGAYDAILWVSSETKNTINQSYRDFASELKVNTRDLKPELIRKQVHSVLIEKHRINKVLFILDNAVDQYLIQNYLEEIQKHWPIKKNPHIIITSRNQHWDNIALILDVFSLDEAKTLIKKSLHNETDKNIQALVNLLHCFPLAISQAVGYIKKHTNISDYLRLYGSKQKFFLDEPLSAESQYKTTLWQILNITLSKLSNTAREVLFTSAYLNPDKIYLNLFVNISTEDLNIAIKELRKYSFITFAGSTDTFKIHSLTQEAIRLMAKSEPRHTTQTTNKTASLFDIYEKMMPASPYQSKIRESQKILVENLQSASKIFKQYHFATYEQVQSWLYHLQSVINHVDSDIIEQHKESILYNYAMAAYDLAQYPLAKKLLSELLVKQQETSVLDTTKRPFVYYMLGLVHVALAEFNMASEQFQTALKYFHNNNDKPNIARSYYWLGNVALYSGKHMDAEIHYKNALGIAKKHPEEIRALPSSILLETGFLYQSMGRYQLASKYYNESLKIIKNYYSSLDNMKFASIFRSLGGLSISIGKYSNAKKFLRDAEKICEKNHQETHPHTAEVYYELGRLYHHLGQYEPSNTYYQKARDIHEASFGENHFYTALCNLPQYINNATQGNYPKNLKHLNKIKNILADHYKENLQQAMRFHESEVLAWPKLTKKNINSAIIFYKNSLPIFQEIYGTHHHLVARHLYMLGQAYAKNGKSKEAIEQYKKSLAISRKIRIEENSIRTAHQVNIKLIESKLAYLNSRA